MYARTTNAHTHDRCDGTLLYNSLSLVYLQVFTVDHFDHRLLDTAHFEPLPGSIDRQIFCIDDPDHKPVERYRLRSFPFNLTLKGSDLHIEGTFHVELSIFFNRTVSITYRMMIDGNHCRKSAKSTYPTSISAKRASGAPKTKSCR